ncbi:MAG: molybdopterin oxidoreductase family protein [Myxococcales bacterium]|nr:molybdopterin oxidoreductase family protein [Myxococcales bacterium]
MTIERSVCPHDCPGACALEVELSSERRVVRIRGAKEMPYTDGVICAKVGRYEERVHHPERLTKPLVRTGVKGEGGFREASWDEALDRIVVAFQAAVAKHGPETVWPYFYAGTMGHVQRDSMQAFTRSLGYSGLEQTICSSIGKAGLEAGIGGAFGTDAREMPESELIVVWGMNPVFTQVNVMSWITKARDRGAKLVVIDPHRSATAEKADIYLPVRPGTDDALACAVMQVLLSEGQADRAFLQERTDFSPELEAHLLTRTPEWAAEITGLSTEEIRNFARLYGATRKSFIRVGYGFTRSRNGAFRLHTVSCLPSISGAWRERGGGFLAASGGVFHLNKTLIYGSDIPYTARKLDMSQIGRVLTGDVEALREGPPVTAMIVQSSNPAVVAPEQNRVVAGLARDDLFLCVHEQFMTDTARYADVVLPATTFLEHPDIYTSYGHTFLQVAKPVIPVHGEARTNHEVLTALATRLGGRCRSFTMTAWEVIEETLRASGYPDGDTLYAMRWYDAQAEPGQVNLRQSFPSEDGRFHFHPDWTQAGTMVQSLPSRPDHWSTMDTVHPFRLVPGPARNFLNSTFTETPTSCRKQHRPTAKIHPEDAQRVGVEEGDRVLLGNDQGQVGLHAEITENVRLGVIVVESVWPSAAFVEGHGINVLTSADPVAPAGGAPFHDTSVWLKRG